MSMPCHHFYWRVTNVCIFNGWLHCLTDKGGLFFFLINIDSLYKHMFPVRLRSSLIHLTLYGSVVDHSKVDRCVQRTFCEPSKIHQLPTKIHMNYMKLNEFWWLARLQWPKSAVNKNYAWQSCFWVRVTFSPPRPQNIHHQNRGNVETGSLYTALGTIWVTN